MEYTILKYVLLIAMGIIGYFISPSPLAKLSEITALGLLLFRLNFNEDIVISLMKEEDIDPFYSLLYILDALVYLLVFLPWFLPLFL